MRQQSPMKKVNLDFNDSGLIRSPTIVRTANQSFSNSPQVKRSESISNSITHGIVYFKLPNNEKCKF
jgi:hypothetical protein